MVKQKIRPQRVEVDCLLRCECGGEQWLTLTEIKAYRKLVCANCGKVTPIDVPRAIVFDYAGEPESSTPRSDTKQEVFIDRAPYVKLLVTLGYSKPDAKQMVDKAIADGLYQKDEQAFIQAIIARLR